MVSRNSCTAHRRRVELSTAVAAEDAEEDAAGQHESVGWLVCPDFPPKKRFAAKRLLKR